MLSRVLQTLLLIGGAKAAVYYVESAPPSPVACASSSPTQPCLFSGLPGTYTTSDKIVFLPATTGSSSTYSLGVNQLLNPSVDILAGVIFSSTRLILRLPATVTCTNATMGSFSGLTIQGNNANSVVSDGCNFNGAEFVVLSSSSVSFTNSLVSGNSGKQITFTAPTVTVQNVVFQSSSTGYPALALTTGGSSSTFVLSDLTFSGWTTSASKSLIHARSVNGVAYSLTHNNVIVDACTIDGAIVQMEILPNGNPDEFICAGDLNGLTVSSTSTKQGLYYLNNNDDKGKIDAQLTTSTSLNGNFNNAAAFLVNANNGQTILHANTESSNNICGPSNLAYLVTCVGVPSKADIFFAGNVEGTQSTQACTNTHISAGNQC